MWTAQLPLRPSRTFVRTSYTAAKAASLLSFIVFVVDSMSEKPVVLATASAKRASETSSFERDEMSSPYASSTAVKWKRSPRSTTPTTSSGIPW